MGGSQRDIKRHKDSKTREREREEVRERELSNSFTCVYRDKAASSFKRMKRGRQGGREREREIKRQRELSNEFIFVYRDKAASTLWDERTFQQQTPRLH